MTNEKNQPVEETVGTTSIAPQDAETKSTELSQEEADKIAAGMGSDGDNPNIA